MIRSTSPAAPPSTNQVQWGLNNVNALVIARSDCAPDACHFHDSKDP